MIPNFSSLAQREEKQLSLHEKAERRKRQAGQKREMYESTQWASDANKTIDLTAKKATTTSSDIHATESVSPLD
jgi:phenylalanyl-tRNA synthetase alpha subunit